VRRYVPNVAYEPGTMSLPVDFRRCRVERCADGPDRRGADVNRAARSGEQATVFTRVLDRRGRGGDLYIQYWLYYPTSNYEGRAVRRRIGLGGAPFDHRDDWESYQVRITPSGEAFARASAHNGYAGRRRWPNTNELPDVKVPVTGWRVGPKRTPAWTRATGWTRVSRGSHAGFIPTAAGDERRTEANGIAIVPIERLPTVDRNTRFEISPPWRKQAYTDPERTKTD